MSAVCTVTHRSALAFHQRGPRRFGTMNVRGSRWIEANDAESAKEAHCQMHRNFRRWGMAILTGTLIMSPTLVAHTRANAAVTLSASPQRVATVNLEVASFLASHTKMSPLVAENLPRVNAPVPLYLTARVTASAGRYSIQYWDTTVPVAVNHIASTAPHGWDMKLFTLSGQAYRTHALAVNALPDHLGLLYRPLTGSSRPVELIPGFDARYYSARQVLSWQEGDWTVEVAQGSLGQDLSEGRRVVYALDRWALPPFPGILTASPAVASGSDTPVGDVYGLDFADGTAVYAISPFYNHRPDASRALVAPRGFYSPLDLVRIANSLVPTANFYHPGVSQIWATATPDTPYAGTDAVISGQLLNQYGQGVANSPFSVTGLPDPPHYVNGVTNAAGRFSVTALFPRAGTYIISAGDRLVGTQITVTVKRSPSTLPPVVAQALAAVAPDTTVPLGGPTILPEAVHGYVTAIAQALPSTYVVFVLNTTKPLGVNNPAISRHLAPHPNLAQFSTARLAGVQPPPGSPHYLQYLAQYNSLFVADSGGTPQTVDLTPGVRATFYDGPKTRALNWSEGDWTIQVEGANLSQEIQAAQPLITYFNHYLLPPYPGIVAVQLLRGGAANVTKIDWMDGHLLSTVYDQTASPLNAMDTVAMATHWQTVRGSSGSSIQR